MGKKIIGYITAILVIFGFSSVAVSAVPVKVSVGRGNVLTLERPSKRVSLANPDLADITVINPSEILLSGKKPGATNLIIWDDREKATVYDIIVQGDTGALMLQIKEVAPEDDIAVDTAEDSIVLRGTVRNEATIEKVKKLALAYAPKVIDFMRVAEPPQILLEVKVAQIDRKKLRELGIGFLAKGIGGDWEITAPGLFATAGGNVGGDAGLDVTPGINNFDLQGTQPQIGVGEFPDGIAGVLRALSTKGLATILAEPNLVVRNGEKGEFLAGSRVPVQQVTGTGGQQTVSIVYEEVGVKLHFIPNLHDSGTIRLKIDPAEVSNIAQFLTFGTIVAPQIDTREVRTSVDLKEGESLVLAGMLSEEMKNNIQKIPLLGDIPILGFLFRSTKEELEKTELAFFITPRLVKPMPPGAPGPELPGEKLTEKEKREYRWFPVPGGSANPGNPETVDEGQKAGEEAK